MNTEILIATTTTTIIIIITSAWGQLFTPSLSFCSSEAGVPNCF